jgi:glutamate 5-kinase
VIGLWAFHFTKIGVAFMPALGEGTTLGEFCVIAPNARIGAGCRMAIADGRAVGALGALIDGKARCSWFLPEGSPLSARKKWIKGSLKTAGALTVDDGAVRALSAGKSLLPAGVTSIEGEFKRGDVVDVKDRAGNLGS